MANENSSLRQRWRNEIESCDPNHLVLKNHRKEIESVYQSARRTMFWSFVSLFYIFGNMHIGVREAYQNAGGEMIVWGIPILGISEKTFLSFLLIMTLYRAVIFLFVVVKIHIIGNLLLALKEIICVSQHDPAWNEFDMKTGFSDGTPVTEKDEEYRGKRDVWLFMMRHRFMGMLEYFLAPIFFQHFCLWQR